MPPLGRRGKCAHGDTRCERAADACNRAEWQLPCGRKVISPRACSWRYQRRMQGQPATRRSLPEVQWRQYARKRNLRDASTDRNHRESAKWPGIRDRARLAPHGQCPRQPTWRSPRHHLEAGPAILHAGRSDLGVGRRQIGRARNAAPYAHCETAAVGGELEAGVRASTCTRCRSGKWRTGRPWRAKQSVYGRSRTVR